MINLEEGWGLMQEGLTKLKNFLEGRPETQFGSHDYIMLYTTVYNMCTQHPPNDYSQQLYDKHREAVEEYLTSTVLPSLRENHGEFLLREFIRRWSLYKVMVKLLSGFFYYLECYFITRKSLPSLNDVGLTRFQDLVFPNISMKIGRAAISLINLEREGEKIDRALLKNVLDIFLEICLGSYENNFEREMLKDSAIYYSRKASIWIPECSCPEYLTKAEECLTREKERVSHYLPSSSMQKLMEEVQNSLLFANASQLLEKEHSGFRFLIENDKVDDLARMYRLFCRIPGGLDPVAQIFRKHITIEGTSLVNEAKDELDKRRIERRDAVSLHEQVFIRKVVELHDKYMLYVNSCFRNHFHLQKALTEAFMDFFNKGAMGDSIAELMATFFDHILKKGGNQKLSDKAFEEILNKVIKLLEYISDKDLFLEFYRKKLARRLLFEKSANDECEKNILTKLKQQHGAQFTSKLEGMFTDLTLARENQAHLEEYLNSNPLIRPEISLSVTILTTGCWPSYKSVDLNLSLELVKCVEVFKVFYLTKTKHRKLTWMYSLGHCVVNGKFEQKTIRLTVTVNQACVLLLFNTSDRLTYTEIKDQLNLADGDLTRTLHSLSCAKFKILLKEPNNSTIDSTDIFEINTKFTCKSGKIKVIPPPADEKKKIVDHVDQDRRYTIDASIIRIMKIRKIMGHNELVMECIEQLASMFKPDLKAIKKRIDDLITREYLERDRGNHSVYRYLA